MVTNVEAAARVEVRPVGPEAFEQIYPLLLDFNSARMGKEDWRRMLFTYAWCSEPYRGFALFAGGKVVGFVGTIFSSRFVAGRSERFCNVSCWIVREAYRSASLLLLKPLLALRDYTILQLTPNPIVYAIFRQLGFVELESEQLLLPPLPANLVEMRALGGATFGTTRSTLEHELAGEHLAIYQNLRDESLTRHVLLRRGNRRCYIVATPSHRKGIRFADIHYISDREFFWQNRLLAHAALLRAMGAAALAVDSRFAEGRNTMPAARRPAMRLYRPSRRQITPLVVDGLYSEWMSLRA